jgi:RimJ/RimL family protein N-acetyltransferase
MAASSHTHVGRMRLVGRKSAATAPDVRSASPYESRWVPCARVPTVGGRRPIRETEWTIEAVPEIKVLALQEWHVLRTTRLRALRESPEAFPSRYETEARWSEAQWRQLLAAATWVVAVEGGAAIGIAGLITHPGGQRYVESIWVSPTHRGRRVFRSIIAALADLCRRLQLAELRMWVIEDNAAALVAYARVGFEPTGERQLIHAGNRRWERCLRLAL